MNTCTLEEPIEVSTSYSKTFLSIGELIISDKPTQIWTVLGSCVSIVLHNPRKKVSALCHAQLTEKEIFGESGSDLFTKKAVKDDFRYVASSINYMLDKMQSMGINKNEIQASVYGGASIIEKFTYQIGLENANAACSVLEKHGIRVIKKDIGGGKSRTIRHYSDTGITQVRAL